MGFIVLILLTLCALLTPDGYTDLGRIGSGNAKLPDGTKPLTETTLSLVRFWGTHLIPPNDVFIMNLKYHKVII